MLYISQLYAEAPVSQVFHFLFSTFISLVLWFSEQLCTVCWVTTAFKLLKPLSTIQPDYDLRAATDVYRLGFRINWGLILLSWGQWKEGLKALSEVERKARKGRVLTVQWNKCILSVICILPWVGSGHRKCYWEGFWHFENNIGLWLRMPWVVSNVGSAEDGRKH